MAPAYQRSNTNRRSGNDRPLPQHRRVGLVSLVVLMVGGVPLMSHVLPPDDGPAGSVVAEAAAVPSPTADNNGFSPSNTGAALPGRPRLAAGNFGVMSTAPTARSVSNTLLPQSPDKISDRSSRIGMPPVEDTQPQDAPAALQVVLYEVPLRAALTLVCDAVQARFRFEGASEGNSPEANPGAPGNATPPSADPEAISLFTGDRPVPLASVLHRLSQSTASASHSSLRRTFHLRTVNEDGGAGDGNAIYNNAIYGGRTEIVVSGTAPRADGGPTASDDSDSSHSARGRSGKGARRRLAGVIVADGRTVCALVETRSHGGQGAPYYELARPGRRLSQASLNASGLLIETVHPNKVVVRNMRTGALTDIRFQASNGEVPPPLAQALGSASVASAQPALLSEADYRRMEPFGVFSGGGTRRLGDFSGRGGGTQ